MPALSDIGWPDLAAPFWYVLLWAGYAYIADHPRSGRSTLMNRMHQYRRAWMRQMVTRDVRIVDTQVTSLLAQNVSFITSNTILLIGGLVAILGARDQVRGLLADIPLVAETSTALWEAKILLLIMTFVYAFFKFTWSLRQFNYVAIMIGAAPPPSDAASPGAQLFAQRTAQVASRAADHFNKALRAYYFGLAALSWLVNAWLFMGLTAWVVVVVWRREFRSATLTLLGPVDEPVGEA
jgi:uncharacterized membrane protein